MRENIYQILFEYSVWNVFFFKCNKICVYKLFYFPKYWLKVHIIFWILGCPVINIYTCTSAKLHLVDGYMIWVCKLIIENKSRTIIYIYIYRMCKRNNRTRDLNSVTVFNIKWVICMGFDTGIMYLVIFFVIIYHGNNILFWEFHIFVFSYTWLSILIQ